MWKSFLELWEVGVFDEMIEELDASFITPQRAFSLKKDNNIFFCYRGSRKTTQEIVNKHFKKVYGFVPEVSVEVEEYEKHWGESETGEPIIELRYYNYTTIVTPTSKLLVV